jgi:hypothetical protein
VQKGHVIKSTMPSIGQYSSTLKETSRSWRL